MIVVNPIWGLAIISEISECRMSDDTQAAQGQFSRQQTLMVNRGGETTTKRVFFSTRPNRFDLVLQGRSMEGLYTWARKHMRGVVLQRSVRRL